jgi:chromosome segregation ATPase
MRQLTGLIFVLAACAAHAQAPRSGGESQAFMQQYQQMAAERSSLKQQLDQLQKTLDGTKAELAEAKKERDALKAKSGAGAQAAAQIAQASAARQTAEQNLEQLKTRTTDLVARFRDTAQNLKQSETERASLQKELAERNAGYDKCASDNLSLSELTDEVLNRYEHVGLFTRASASEPFTKITRAKIDNLVDDYRTRAMELRTKERAH